MKKRVLLLTVFVLFLSLFLTGCGGNKAISLLNEANKNFMDLESYIKVKYEVNRLNEEHIETKVNFTQYLTDGDFIVTNNNKNFTLGYPKIISNGKEIRESKPTLVIERFPVEELKAQVNEYISPEGDYEYVSFKNYEVMTEHIKINKNDMFHLLETVLTGKEENILIDTYTMGLFNINVFPEKISDLNIKEENENYYILEGTVKGNGEEMFLIYEEATVEIWIDKDSNLIAKEIYRDKSGTEEDFIIFEYIHFNEEEIPESFFKETDLEEKIKFYTDLL